MSEMSEFPLNYAPLIDERSKSHPELSPETAMRYIDHAQKDRRVEFGVVNGKPVEYQGVFHHWPTQELYAGELRGAIERASLVILEGAPSCSDIYGDKSVEAHLNIFRKQNPKITKEEVLKRLKTSGSEFFAQMEAMAAKAGKPVARIDPNAFIPDVGMLGHSAITEGNNDLIEGAGYIGLAAGTYALSRLSEKNAITRRAFLKSLGIMAGLGATAKIAPGILDPFMHPNLPDSVRRFLKSAYDYRETISAKALLKLSEKNFGPGPIVLIFATAHNSVIQRYVEAPTLLDEKYLEYDAVRNAAPPKLTVHSFDPVQKEWIQIMEEKI